MSNWIANFINDPNHDYDLMVEILYNNKDVAIITQEKQNLKFTWYANDKDIIIPFDWLFSVINEAKDVLMVNNVITRGGKVIWRFSRSLISILHDCLKEKINKIKTNKAVYNFIKELDRDLSNDDVILIEINSIFKTKKDIQEFILIFHSCIDEMSEKFHWPNEIKDYIYTFCRNLE